MTALMELLLLFVLFVNNVLLAGCLSPRQYYWWLQRQQRHRHLHGPNVCTVERLAHTGLAFHTECRNWMLPRTICGVEAELTFECCAGFTQIKGQPGCSAAGRLDNVLVTLRHVGAEWMASLVMEKEKQGMSLTPGGAVTVFTPTEKAWSTYLADASNEITSKYKLIDKNKIKEGKEEVYRLEDSSLYHIVRGRHRLSDLKHNTVLPPIDGKGRIMVTKYQNGMTAVNCARVLSPNREATDGMIHIIDRVMSPPDGRTIAELLRADHELSQFAGLLRKSGLMDKLSHRHRLTVFAPTDKAFNMLQQRQFSHILRDKALLKALLRYHIVDDTWCTAGMTSSHEAFTLESSSVNMTCSQDGVKVNDARIIKPDLVVRNGIIHKIDQVLFPSKAQNLWSLLTSVGATKLAYFMSMTGLNSTLSQEKSLTVFAPTNKAFNALPGDTVKRLQTDTKYLHQVLAFHVATGRQRAANMMRGQRFRTLGGGKVRVFIYPWVTGVETACVVQEDIIALNGVVHLVDSVLLPPDGSVADIISTRKEFSILGEALQLSGLVTVVQARGAFTLLAPSNRAFQNLPSRIRDSLLRDPTQLTKILRYHVIDEIHVTCSIKSRLVYPLVSLLGQEVTVRRQGDDVMVGDAVMVEPDVMATNGVIHVIDRVLLPT